MSPDLRRSSRTTFPTSWAESILVTLCSFAYATIPFHPIKIVAYAKTMRARTDVTTMAA